MINFIAVPFMGRIILGNSFGFSPIFAEIFKSDFPESKRDRFTICNFRSLAYR